LGPGGVGPVAGMPMRGFGAGNQPVPIMNMGPRLGTAANMRPSTPGMGGMGVPSMAAGGMSVSRQGTAGRPPSTAFKRLGTAGGAPPGSTGPIGLDTELKVSHRPVTQHGLSGMQTKPLGPGRQLADKSYFMSELRNKLADIENENAKMKEEVDKQARDAVTYATYERKYETVVKEVRHLENQLANFNLVIDKLRTHTEIDEVMEAQQRLERSNELDRKQVDQIFLKAAAVKRQIADAEAKIQALQASAAQRMRSLGEAAAEEYHHLQDDENTLHHVLNDKHEQLDTVNQKIAHAQAELRSEGYQIHKKGLELQKQRKALLQSKKELEEDEESALTPQETRDRLLQKVKEANANISANEKRVRQLEDHVEQRRERNNKLENDLAEAESVAKSQKYTLLFDRDKKMQEYIHQKYPELKRQTSERQAQLQDTIVALLHHISRSITSQQNLPSAERFAELKAELSFKDQTLANSKNTLLVLNKELDARRDELDKINSLDSKITNELQLIKDKIQSMQSEMASFKPEATLQKEANEAKMALMKEKQATASQVNAVKAQVALVSAAYRSLQKELSNDETAKKLEAMEQKMRTTAQSVTAMHEYVTSRQRESDFEKELRSADDLVDKLNEQIIISLAQAQSTRVV